MENSGSRRPGFKTNEAGWFRHWMCLTCPGHQLGDLCPGNGAINRIGKCPLFVVFICAPTKPSSTRYTVTSPATTSQA